MGLGRFFAHDLIAGWLYDDDALIASNLYCDQYLYMGTQKLWPCDVGTTLEESGYDISFLQSRVRSHDNFDVTVEPLIKNGGFAQNCELHPDISRLSSYLLACASTL